MNRRATILIPTFCHPHTLSFSLASALRQTIKDIEVFVVGDGVDDTTRQVISKFKDKRLHFFDFPKGERHGELYRHEVLLRATGEIVCYLSDDDLYAPNHVEAMLSTLKDKDFAASLTVWVHPDQHLQVQAHDLTQKSNVRLILEAQNLISLSFAAHTATFYKTLPHGWQVTPESYATDYYMWKQILTQPNVRPASSFLPTALHFPQSLRRDWTEAMRVEELSIWSKKLKRWKFEDEFQKAIYSGLIKTASRDYSNLYIHYFYTRMQAADDLDDMREAVPTSTSQ